MKKDWKYYLGLCFLVYSFIPLLSMAALPFLGLSLAESGAFALVFLTTGEISFWIAAALLGKELIAAIKRKVFALMRRSASPKPVSRLRHRIGIAMLLVSFLPYYATLVYLIAFSYDKTIVRELTWSMIAGEIICYASFFVLGGVFWERFKDLFRWSGEDAVPATPLPPQS